MKNGSSGSIKYLKQRRPICKKGTLKISLKKQQRIIRSCMSTLYLAGRVLGTDTGSVGRTERMAPDFMEFCEGEHGLKKSLRTVCGQGAEG